MRTSLLASPLTALLLALSVLSTTTFAAAAESGGNIAGWWHDGTLTDPPTPPSLNEGALRATVNEIDRHLRDDSISGATVSALITEAATGRVLFERNSDSWLKPASNTKMFSTAAALSLLGPNRAPETRVLTTGPLTTDGTVQGDMYLFGDHDMTWSTDFYPSSQYVAERLALQLEVAGVQVVQGSLRVRGLFVVNGHRFGTFDHSAHLVQAAETFRRALARRGISVLGGLDVVPSFEIPGDANVVASWAAVPLHVVVASINRMSHNEYADSLMRWIGSERLGTSSYASGEEAVRLWAESVGIDVSGLSLNDGSGLSHDNRISAEAIVELHAHMLSGPLAGTWMLSLSSTARNGTYANRMQGDDTAGRVFCKSGTIDGVITGSGIVNNRHDGGKYIFALLMNNLTSQSAARQMQDRIVEEVAKDLRRAGVRPDAPRLNAATTNGDTVTVSWLAPGEAERCDVEASRDLNSWAHVGGASAARGYLRVRPTIGETFAWRVRCSNAGGTSDPSDSYAGGVGVDGAAHVLLVDGNDRWANEPAEENTMLANHDFVARYADALDGATVSSRHHSEVPQDDEGMAVADVTLWSYGEQGGDWAACDAGAQQWMTRYSDLGKALILTGSEAAWHACEREETGTVFLADVFGAEFASDNAGTRVALTGIDGATEALYFLDPTSMFIGFPDALRPMPGSSTCAQYPGASGDAACVRNTSAGRRTAVVGFPPETIADTELRTRWVRYLVESLLGSR